MQISECLKRKYSRGSSVTRATVPLPPIVITTKHPKNYIFYSLQFQLGIINC